MTKFLVLPDIHERFDEMVATLKLYEDGADLVVFLGDYFDSWDGVTDRTNKMIYWLLENVNNPKYKFLYGNHDVHYLPESGHLRCSGWDPTREAMIQRKLKWDNFWSKLDFLYFTDDFLLSHAGMSHRFLSEDLDRSKILELNTLAKNSLRAGLNHYLLQAGAWRGGGQVVGGPTWLDWNVEFSPVSGLNQIVGHTEGRIPRFHRTPESENICLDTSFSHCAYVTGKEVEILPTAVV